MEFKCKNKKCETLFRPHRFIGFKHPGNARCPDCGGKGVMTNRGKKMFNSRHMASNMR